jgi:hypothetical protein
MYSNNFRFKQGIAVTVSLLLLLYEEHNVLALGLFVI